MVPRGSVVRKVKLGGQTWSRVSLWTARLCVRLFERMREDRWLQDGLAFTGHGRDKLSEIGLELADLPSSNRPLCRSCLDWSQRRQHLAGRAGKAILDRVLALSWARRLPESRIISFDPEGERRFNGWLG